MGTTNEVAATPPEELAARQARRPDLSLLERVRLVARLLGEAPSLPTATEKRLRLITCESLLRYCYLELETILGGNGVVAYNVTEGGRSR